MPDARLDRINSRELIAAARLVYFQWLTVSGGGLEPLGVVLAATTPSSRGRMVFEAPVLLPGESYVPLAWLGLRTGSRPRGARAASSRPPASAPQPSSSSSSSASL